MSQRNNAERIIRTHAQDLRIAERQDGDDDDTLRIEGYAITWADQYDMEPWWSEKIAKGAFAESLKERDVAVLNGHMREQVIASTRSGTKLSEDDKGLKFNAVLNATSIAKDVYVMVENDDVKGVSVGMRIQKESREEDAGKDGMPLYTIERAELHEFSMTAFPAYEATSAEAREANEHLIARRQPVPDDAADGVATRSRRLALRLRHAKISRRLHPMRLAI